MYSEYGLRPVSMGMVDKTAESRSRSTRMGTSLVVLAPSFQDSQYLINTNPNVTNIRKHSDNSK